MLSFPKPRVSARSFGLADITKNRLSILTPVGIALLGYREGDVIEWKVLSGTRVLKVESVIFQPESAGQFDL